MPEHASIAPHRDQFVCRVIENRPLCREHFRLVLKTDAFPPTAPGQFIQVACRDLSQRYSPQHELEWRPGQPLGIEGRELMAPLALLRRPFSLAGRRDTREGVELEIIHRVVGIGTDWLSRLARGDDVHILGPLGNRFELPPRDVPAVLVGGGVGIPPMLYLATSLAGRPAVAFAGALRRDLLPLTIVDDHSPGEESTEPCPIIGEFSRHGVPAIITTDDGSYGFRGYVTQALERYLDRTLAHRDAPRPILYTCGPEPMMKRVAEIALTRGLECQIAVERAMACGMGTCQSCVIRVREKSSGHSGQQGWRYRLACTDGPVFRAGDLLW